MNQYPIRAISELTGVPTTTLRAWERRYGLLKPARTPKGHRLYATEDVDLVKEVVILLKNDHSISEAIRIINNPDQKSAQADTADDHWSDYQQRMLKSVEAFNEQSLNNIYNEALSIYPIDWVTERLIIPVLQVLGERWQSREAGIAEEHFYSAYLRNKLGARLHHDSQRSTGSKILVSCLPGEYHELGLLLFCIAAIGRGYQVLYLGTNMPPDQLPSVVKRSNVSAILLSGTKAERWSNTQEAEIKKQIQSSAIPVMFGGRFSETCQAQLENMGAHTLGSSHVQALEKMESIIPAFAQK